MYSHPRRIPTRGGVIHRPCGQVAELSAPGARACAQRKGAAGSWQMENRGKTMNQDKFDFGFAVDWMRKDLSIVLAEARKNGA